MIIQNDVIHKDVIINSNGKYKQKFRMNKILNTAYKLKCQLKSPSYVYELSNTKWISFKMMWLHVKKTKRRVYKLRIIPFQVFN